MFLRTTKHKSGKTYLSICKSFRDPVSKKIKQKTVLSLGYMEDLMKEYSDPIEHFKQVAKNMTDEENKDKVIELRFNTDELMDVNTNDMKNIGFAVISKIYHELEIDKFLINRERGIKANLPLNNVMKLLVYDRILHPSSKKSSYENRDMYFENFNFPLESLYRSLPHFSKHKEKLLFHIHENVKKKYGTDTSNVFYDVTNYYFHTEDETDLIAKGFSKDRKGKPIVQMGLLLDNQGIPISYKLFKGNTTDYETLLPVLAELKRNYNLPRAIVVADKGLNSGTNKAYAIIKGDGYIFSRSLRGTKADKEVKAYALDPSGYRGIGDEYKIKSRIYPTDIWVQTVNGNKKKVTIDEKHIVFYSEKYAKRTRHKRNELIAKAVKLIESPSRFAKAENYGAMKYIEGLKLDKQTGELIPIKKDVIPKLNIDLIKDEEMLDGYYSIVTSELDMPETKVIDNYKGLWKIEESFRITKTELKSRPVYLKKDEHIEAHFLSCFISLLIIRVLELITNNRYSAQKMIDSLKFANVDLIGMNKYKAVYYDEILEDIDRCIGTNLRRKYLSLYEIKKMISSTK